MFSRVAALCAAGSLAALSAHAAGPVVPPWGVDLGYVDKTVAPGDDFFVHANGGWLKTAEIPPDRSFAGVNLELDKQNEEKLRNIMVGLHAKSAPTDEERKLRDFYDTFTDTQAIEATGLSHAEVDLAKIASLKNATDVAAAMGTVRLGLDGPFGIYLGVDDKHPNVYSVNLYQSGLALPDRDYYLRDDKEIAEARTAYQKYIVQMLSFLGDEDAEARASAILKLEHEMAVAHWPAADRRDANKTYNPMPISDLEKMAPEFPWRIFLQAAGVPMTSPKGERMVIVAERSAFPKLAAVFAATPVSVWRDYSPFAISTPSLPICPRNTTMPISHFMESYCRARRRNSTARRAVCSCSTTR